MAASKKGTGRKGSGQEEGGITNVFVVLLLFAVLMLLIVYFSNKKKEEEVDNTITPTLQASAGSEDGKEEGKVPDDGNAGAGTNQNGENPQGEGQSGEKPGDSTNSADGNNVADNSGNQEGDGQNATAPPSGNEPDNTAPTSPESQEGDDAPEATQPSDPTPTPKPTEPAPDGLLTKEEAEDILAGEIRERDYSYQLSDENMELDGKQYFCYKIFHQQQEENYSVLVDKENGDVFHYDGSSMTEFQGVSYYAKNTAPGNDAAEGMTKEKAKQLLSGFSPASLMLPASLDECSLSLDEWQTVVKGDECYCLNVFYKDELAGSIYFTEDGGKVYYLDEFNEFVPVR